MKIICTLLLSIALLTTLACEKVEPIKLSSLLAQNYAEHETAIKTLNDQINNIIKNRDIPTLETLENNTQNRISFYLAVKNAKESKPYIHTPTLTERNTLLLMDSFFSRKPELQRFGKLGSGSSLLMFLERANTGSWDKVHLGSSTKHDKMLDGRQQKEWNFSAQKALLKLDQIEYLIISSDISYMPALLTDNDSFYSGGVILETKLYNLKTGELIHTGETVAENLDSAPLVNVGSSTARRAQARVALRSQLEHMRFFSVIESFGGKPF